MTFSAAQAGIGATVPPGLDVAFPFYGDKLDEFTRAFDLPLTSDGPLRSPAGVDAWYNAYDGHDVVALYPLDAHNFPVQPAITNYGKVHNSTDDRHGITGYLDDPDVAKHILAALGR